MKLIIAGGRNQRLSLNDKDVLYCLDMYQDGSYLEVTEVVSGGANGIDKDGEEWAKSMGITVKVFEADWDTHGPGAGPIRNLAMAQYADALALFPGGKGTRNMFGAATREGLKIYDYR